MVVTSEAQMIIAVTFAVCSRQNWINFIKLQGNFKCTEDLCKQSKTFNALACKFDSFLLD